MPKLHRVRVVRLPADVIQRILSDLDGTYNVAQCMLVCREWKPLAEHILYSNIEFNDPNVVQQFAYTIKKAMVQGRYLARHIRSLTMKEHAEDSPASDTVNYVLLILSHAINLQTIRLCRDTVTTSMVMLSQTAKISLRVIDFWIHDSIALYALTYINQFSGLQELSIRIETRIDEDDMPFTQYTPAWTLHRLRSFACTAPYIPAVMDFFDRCDIPSLRTLNLSIPTSSDEEAQRIVALCSRWSLQRLRLGELPQETQLYHLIIPSLKTICLHVAWDDPVLVQLLPATVTTLFLDMPDQHDDYCKLLLILEALLHTMTNVRNVHFKRYDEDDWEPFRWVSGDVSEDGYPRDELRSLRKLLWYSTALERKGIALRDGYDKTVSDYYTRS